MKREQALRTAWFDPRELIPLEPPHRPDTVESLRAAYASGDIDRIPPIIVHRVKGRGIYMADGHHRTGVAHAFNEPVQGIFLNSYQDLRNIYTLIDLQLFPDFNLAPAVESTFLHLGTELPKAHNEYAKHWRIRNFDDYTHWLKQGKYHDPDALTNFLWYGIANPQIYYIDIAAQNWPT
jgi:hypothetical protein